MTLIHCAGPGPHAPEDGILGETADEDHDPIGPSLCAACGLLVLPSPSAAPSTQPVEVNPSDLETLRARLTTTGTTAAVLRDLIATLTPTD